MVNQYNHSITYSVKTADVKTNGNWTEGSTATVTKNCRYETKDGDAFVSGVDGTHLKYTGIVYMPLPQSYLVPGTVVEVKDGSQVLLKSTVKQCLVGQLNARLWL